MVKREIYFLLLALLCVFFCIGIVSVAHADPVTGPSFSTNESGDLVIEGGSFPSLNGNGNGTQTVTLLNNTLGKYKMIALFVVGLCTITAFLFFILSVVKLAHAGANEQERRRAIMGIFTTLTAIMLLGGSGFLIAFFWNALG